MAMAMMMEGRWSDGDGGGKGVRADGGSAGGDNARLGFARVDTVTDNAGPNRARHRSSQRTDRRRRLGTQKGETKQHLLLHSAHGYGQRLHVHVHDQQTESTTFGARRRKRLRTDGRERGNGEGSAATDAQ